MTTEEYTAARRSLHLSQGKLAEALGVTRQTINRRETIPGRVTREAELAIRALAKIKH